MENINFNNFDKVVNYNPTGWWSYDTTEISCPEAKALMNQYNESTALGAWTNKLKIAAVNSGIAVSIAGATCAVVGGASFMSIFITTGIVSSVVLPRIQANA